MPTSKKTQNTGKSALAFTEFISQKLSQIKSGSQPPAIPLMIDRKIIGVLEPVTYLQKDDQQLIHFLARLRRMHANWFPSQFPVTMGGTQKWLKENVLDLPDRILFLICIDDIYIGHMGLYRFDYQTGSAEIDNVVRGRSEYPGIMTAALHELMSWSKITLNLKKLTLRTFGDNVKAISLYQRCGFHRTNVIPLVKIRQGKIVSFAEAKPGQIPDRYFQVMEISLA
jgi:RimJ/RimL family protein N-acetyltransferase